MTRLTIYGDFNCPFSALASARADVLLAAGGYEIDWRAIQHDPAIPAAGEPVEGDTAAELAAEVATILDLSEHDVRLHLLVPPVRSNTGASRPRPSRPRATTRTGYAGGSSPPCGSRAATSRIPPSSIVSARVGRDQPDSSPRVVARARRTCRASPSSARSIRSAPSSCYRTATCSRGLGALARRRRPLAAAPSAEGLSTMASDDFEERIAGVASLAEPQRRALYRFVVGRGDAVSKDEAAAAMGVARSVAAFHLDRLVADGLLTTEFRRLTGRQGPGAGRPAKLYRRAEGELSVSLPARQYDLAAGLLAAAVNDATRTGTPVGEALTRVATERGRALGERARRRQGSGRAGAPSSTPPSPCSTSKATNPACTATRSCSPTARSTPWSTNSATWCAA